MLLALVALVVGAVVVGILIEDAAIHLTGTTNDSARRVARIRGRTFLRAIGAL